MTMAISSIIRFWKREQGSTPFMIVWFLLLLIVSGIAVDSANGWRHHQLLKQTSDVAAHSAVLALLDGQSETAVRDRAQQKVAENIPFSSYGPVLSDPLEDIVLLNYDPATNTISRSGPANAVGVRLRRDRSIGNPVDTYILRIAGIASAGADDVMSSWDIRAFGVAALAEIQRCSSTSGIYAKGQINLTSSNSFGSGHCIHSQNKVWMPQQNRFAAGSGLSMPDLANCGDKCNDSANPGAAAAAFEQNLIIPDVAAHIAATETAFLSASSDLKSEFFRGKQLDSDLAPLAAISVSTTGLTTGSVVKLSRAQFMSLTRIPKGLTYHVPCITGENTEENRALTLSDTNARALRDVAIITGCRLSFGQGADVAGTLLLSKRKASSASVSSAPNARIGSSQNTCSAANRTFVMSMGDIDLPANVTGSNLSIMTPGNIHLAANPDTAPHTGLSLIANGEVHVAAQNEFVSCDTARTGLTAAPRVIRHVEPTWRS